jgi:hypothetical protein
MFTKALATHELLVKNFFEVHLKKNGNFAFIGTLDFG